MSDLKPVSPLNGASTKGFATVREIGPLGMISLRAKPDVPGLAAAVKAVTGTDHAVAHDDAVIGADRAALDSGGGGDDHLSAFPSR